MRWGAVLLSACIWATQAARAADITIGMAAAATSADPHFHAFTPNNQLAHHVFSTLVESDAHQTMQPGIADRWELEGDRSWIMHLHPGVKFHDGSDFTARDVVYSLCRVLHPSGPTGSFQVASRSLAGIDVIDDLTLRLRMNVPDPGFLNNLGGVHIISARSAGAGVVTFDVASGCGDIPTPKAQDFDSLKMANGTGPYRLVAYSSGETVVLEANNAYWGRKPHWDRVTLKALPNAGARLAGLLAGEIDLIENPSAQDLPTIKAHGGLAYAAVPSSRIIFLQPDIARDPSPLASDKAGHNPLRDARVREAISLAIDRRAITTRLLDGLAVPADRFTPEGLFGALTDKVKIEYDPARAKALLAEAGATGMTLTLSATRDRYISDAAVAQAIGQYLSRVGIAVKVDAMAQVNFFPGRARKDFSFAMGGWGYGSEGVAYMLRPWLAHTDPVRGFGGSNYGGYESEAFNAAFDKAVVEMDDARRTALLQTAERQALADHALIPLYWETSLWAFKDRYSFAGRADQATYADDLSLKE